MSKAEKTMDAYRRFARRHPLRFIGISIILVILWISVIMFFSDENADQSGYRSASVLVGIINAVAPDANVTMENYEQIPALENSERVVRKLAHMTEYGILTALVWSLCFGFRDIPRNYSYLIPVLVTFCVGITDEANQTTVDGRYGSWFDVCVDTSAAVITVAIARYLTNRYRQKKREKKNSSLSV